jgi:hypothetical protein
MAKGDTSLVKTLLAPITALSPIVIPGFINTLAPIQTPFPIRISPVFEGLVFCIVKS